MGRTIRLLCLPIVQLDAAVDLVDRCYVVSDQFIAALHATSGAQTAGEFISMICCSRRFRVDGDDESCTTIEFAFVTHETSVVKPSSG